LQGFSKRHTIFARGIVSSGDLCYNGIGPWDEDIPLPDVFVEQMRNRRDKYQLTRSLGMKFAKVVGSLFVVAGLLFAIIGTVNYVLRYTEKDHRIYTTAHIIKIDERKTGDPEFPIEYTTHVEFEVNGEKITSELNTYRSNFKIGKSIDIYYLENDLQMVYQRRSDAFFFLFAVGGGIFAILGAISLKKQIKTKT
jgi:hypothetical protein